MSSRRRLKGSRIDIATSSLVAHPSWDIHVTPALILTHIFYSIEKNHRQHSFVLDISVATIHCYSVSNKPKLHMYPSAHEHMHMNFAAERYSILNCPPKWPSSQGLMFSWGRWKCNTNQLTPTAFFNPCKFIRYTSPAFSVVPDKLPRNQTLAPTVGARLGLSDVN